MSVNSYFYKKFCGFKESMDISAMSDRETLMPTLSRLLVCPLVQERKLDPDKHSCTPVHVTALTQPAPQKHLDVYTGHEASTCQDGGEHTATGRKPLKVCVTW